MPVAALADAGYVELQPQVNGLRIDLPGERERHVKCRLETSGAVLVVLGILIGMGGTPWGRLRSAAVVWSVRGGSSLTPPDSDPGSRGLRQY